MKHKHQEIVYVGLGKLKRVNLGQSKITHLVEVCECICHIKGSAHGTVCPNCPIIWNIKH